MVQVWRNLSVAKKLYTVVGVMALLIATELFTLMFAMDILSSVRSFVGGEGLWSKAQKNAIYNLHRFSKTRDPEFWERFRKNIEIPAGDHLARIELEKNEFDPATVIRGFVQGGIHPDDARGLVRLIRRFYWVRPIHDALVIWRQADDYIEKINILGERLHLKVLAKGSDSADIESIMREIDRLNEELTPIEVGFSEVLGQGSRDMETRLMILLVLAVLTVESTGLFLTISFGRNLSHTLHGMMSRMRAVGNGDFSQTLPVTSGDELGQLAQAINKMTRDLSTSRDERAQAENASQFKSLFLANMSHEIRTPLGVILGLAEILKDRNLSATEYRQYVDTIERTGGNLLRIVNDILDLSKVEAGRLEIDKTKFSLSELMREVQSLMSLQATRAEVALGYTIAESVTDIVTSDRTRLRQILINLVSNALKFTSKGTVKIDVHMRGKTLFFDVSDSGSGMSEIEKERLFRLFERGSKSTEGTGLGLVLARGLARALSGDLELIKTAPGEGSTFRLSLVIEAASAHKPPVEEAPLDDAQAIHKKLAGRSVLVVEDSEDNRLLVRLFLTRQGMRVTFAENGMEGLKCAVAGNFDAVLMDMQMPIMDGYKATYELRKLGYKVPIIALTAHAMKEDRDRCLSVGCDDYLTKPINSNKLFSTLAIRIR